MENQSNNVLNKSINLKWNKENVFFLLKILFSLGLIFFIAFKLDFNEIINLFYGANYKIIAFVVLISFLNIYLQFSKWKLLCNVCLNEKHNKKIFISLFNGITAGAFTPARIGEYIGRGIAFPNISLIDITVTTIIDKLFNLIVIVFLGAIASIIFLLVYFAINPMIIVSLFLVVFGLFLFFIILILNENLWQNFIIQWIAKVKLFRSLGQRIKYLKNLDKRILLRLGLLSLLFYCCFIFQYALLVKSFTHSGNLLIFFWIGMLMFFVQSVIPPITIGELGIRETASIYFVSSFGFQSQAGFNASILIFIINILLPALFGMFLFYINGKQNNKKINQKNI